MRKIIIFIVIFAFGLSIRALCQISAVHHYLPILTKKQVADYKGYNMIIVDHEVILSSANNLALMRRDNPGLIILAYVNKIEWHEPMFSDKRWSLEMVAELKKYPKWFLRDPRGNKLEFWPQTVLMNCRLDCPRYTINGRSYSYIEWFTERYIQDVIGAYKKAGINLDGILDDELLKFISFIGNYGNNRHGIDSNGDGLNDDAKELDRQWRLGNAYFLQAVREAMGKDFIIIGNGGHGYYLEWCNGKMFEYFPEIFLNENDKLCEAWPENMRNAAGMEIAIFNARANAYGKSDNWQTGLYSAMLLDNVIFSHGQNTPFNPKYNLNLGKPKGRFYQSGSVFSRKYEKGTINFDPVSKKAWIERK